MPTKVLTYATTGRNWWTHWSKNPVNGTITSSSGTTAYSMSSCGYSRTGDRLVGYRKIIERGENATTDMSLTALNVDDAVGRYNLSWTRLSAPYDTNIDTALYRAPYVTPSSVFTSASELSDQCKVLFLKKAKRRLTHFQGHVFIGELIEIVQMIRNPAKTFRKGFDSFLSDVKKRAKGLKIAAGQSLRKKRDSLIGDTWLEYAFGWQPLVNDVISGAEALAIHAEKILPSEFVTKTVRSFDEEQPSFSSLSVPGTAITLAQRTQKRSVNMVKFYGRVGLAEGSVPTPPSILFGVTLRDMAPAAWELLPWSFLIDYFTNIGDLIEAASFPIANLRWVSNVIKRENIAETVINPHESAATVIPSHIGKVHSYSGPQVATTVTRKDIERSRNVSMSLPSIRFDLGLGSKQMFNIAALYASKNKWL